MSSNSHATHRYYLLASYALLLGAGIYLGWNLEGIHPRFVLLAILAALGLVTGAALMAVAKKSVIAGDGKSPWAPLVLHALIQGGVGFAIAFFLFKLSWQNALAFPIGAAAALLTWGAICQGHRPVLASLISALLVAGPFVIALRLGGIHAGFLFGLGLMNASLLGAFLFTADEEKREQWVRVMVFGSFLVLGRAAIQYYLLTSGYASLGVVVTQPYTFIALFLGLIIPVVYPYLQQERVLPMAVLWIALGLVLPLALGVFIHVRPIAAYLLGLVVSGFAVGLVQRAPLCLAFFGYLSLIAVCAGYPLFKATANLSRVVRLEILGGIFLLVVIAYFLLARNPRPPAEAAS